VTTTITCNPGDTIYFCGPFAAVGSVGTPVIIASSGTAAAPITIRMDYPADAGTFYNSIRSSPAGTSRWTGPDPNNGYYRFGAYNNPDHHAGGPIGLNFGEAGEEFPPLRTSMKLSDPNGCYFDSATYVKRSDGRDPSNGKLYMIGTRGFGFVLTGQSYITFRNCTSVGPLVNTARGAKDISFEGCTSHHVPGIAYTLYKGNDDWSWTDCTIHHAYEGIYALFDNADPGQSGLRGRVLRGHFSYIGSAGGLDYASPDGDGIGTQMVSGWVIDGVEIDHVGCGVDMWSDGSYPSTDNEVRNCIIHDLSPSSTGGSDGISVMGGAHRIHNNVIWNIGGRGINAYTTRPSTVENNSIYNVGLVAGWWNGSGIKLKEGSTCRNNIIQGCGFFIELFPNSALPTTIDYNLFSGHGTKADFYSAGNETLAQWQTRGYDIHSRTGLPGWTKYAPAAWADFHLLKSSQAIASGAVVSYLDPDGKPIGKTMGAYAAPNAVPKTGFVAQPTASPAKIASSGTSTATSAKPTSSK
jgi:hypothetical protein